MTLWQPRNSRWPGLGGWGWERTRRSRICQATWFPDPASVPSPSCLLLSLLVVSWDVTLGRSLADSRFSLLLYGDTSSRQSQLRSLLLSRQHRWLHTKGPEEGSACNRRSVNAELRPGGLRGCSPLRPARSGPGEPRQGSGWLSTSLSLGERAVSCTLTKLNHACWLNTELRTEPDECLATIATTARCRAHLLHGGRDSVSCSVPTPSSPSWPNSRAETNSPLQPGPGRISGIHWERLPAWPEGKLPCQLHRGLAAGRGRRGQGRGSAKNPWGAARPSGGSSILCSSSVPGHGSLSCRGPRPRHPTHWRRGPLGPTPLSDGGCGRDFYGCRAGRPSSGRSSASGWPGEGLALESPGNLVAPNSSPVWPRMWVVNLAATTTTK